MTHEEYTKLSRQRRYAYDRYKFWDSASNKDDIGVIQNRFAAANEYNRLNELCREWECEETK